MMLPDRCPVVPALGTTREPKPPDLVPKVAVQVCPACKPLHDRGVVKLEFANVNVMAVAHGTDKDVVLQHKAAIDDHLRSINIPVSYTNVFWGGRSEIKPSEISPFAYQEWCKSAGLDPESMKD